MKNLNKKGYSVIISLLMVWFLLVLSTGIFNLVLKEMKDNRGMWDYIKAYAWAESAKELALLKIKKNGYWYYDKIDHNINDYSIVLAKNPINKSSFNKSRDVFISYDIWTKVNEYSDNLNSLDYHIIPLFYLDDSWEYKARNISVAIKSGISSDLAWNIIWKDSWISWVWTNITSWVEKKLVWGVFKHNTININTFLNDSESNYLVLVNTANSWNISYTLKSNNSWEFFTKPKASIISSAEVWKYRQNIITELDNTKFLNMLKYSIYSN